MRRAAVVGALVLWVATAPSAAAADGAITATVVPKTVEMSTGEHSQVHLLVTNGAKVPASRLAVAQLPANAGGVKVALAKPTPHRVAPGRTQTVLLDVSTTETLFSERVVSLLLRLTQAGKRMTMPLELTVRGPAPVDATKIANLEINTSLGQVESDTLLLAHAVVRNLSAEKLQFGAFRLAAPDFMTLKAQGNDSFELAPYATHQQTLRIEVDKRVQTGKHQLVFALPLQGSLPLTLTTAKEADVSVEGESALLTAFGVPVLFLLPGALLLGVPLSLYKLRVLRHRSDTDAFDPDVKSVSFVAISVGLSLLVVVVWRWIGTDLFEEYGLGDIFAVIGACVATGAVLYLVPMSIRFLRQARRTPKGSDDEIDVLRKLGRQGLKLRLPRYEQAYMLQPLDVDRPVTWFAPAINWTLEAGAPRDVRDRIQALRDADDPEGVASELEQARKAKHVTFRFADGPSPGPFARKTADIAGNPVNDALLHLVN